MRNQLRVLILIGFLLLVTYSINLGTAAQQEDHIRIFGLVNRPSNITIGELLSLPMVSEVANLLCVWRYPNVTYNWTGIPLFHLLTLAEVRPEAREVVFRASDGFSASLLIEDALESYVLLGVKANGTLLSSVDVLAPSMLGGFRVVVPCKYGYKWVALVKEIEVVDYDYKGTYDETFGYTEQDAIIPNCVSPSTNPPIQTYNVTFGVRDFHIKAFTNISISAFNFNHLQKEIDFNVTVPSGTTGFADLIIPQSLLKGPYSVLLDENPISIIEANVTNRSFLYMPFSEGSHALKVIGTEFFGMVPEIVATYNSTGYVGDVLTFNASASVDDGLIVSYKWDFGDNTTGSGAVVYHSYVKDGLYSVKLNVTDDEGISNFAILTVDVKKLEEVPVFGKAFLVGTLGLLIVLFSVMFLQRKSKTKSETVAVS
jgi:hypothetical protein